MSRTKPKRSRKLQGAALVIEKLMGKLDLHEIVREHRIKQAWQEWFGDSVSRRSFVERVADGTAYIVAESPVWRMELRHMTTEIVERMGEVLGARLVQRLNVRVGVVPAPPKAPPPETSSAELTPQVQALLEQQVADIEDEDLRASVLRALVAHAKTMSRDGIA